MLIELIIALLLGCTIGTFTGLIPGIHINLVGLFLVSLTSIIFTSINPIYLVTFIVSVAITHTFIDFIPSIFLGCPDTDTELSILPGHEMLKDGKAYEAIMLSAYGGLAAVIVLLFLSYPSIILVPKFYDLIKNSIPFILIITSSFLIFSEKNKLSALFVFFITGSLGLIILNLTLEENNLIFPLLTGLFGGSSLILSLKNKVKIPKQIITKTNLSYKPLLGAFIASPICSFLPGMGSGQAAIIGNWISKTNSKGFLMLLGATNTLVMGFSFISLYTIYKTRTGAAKTIQDLIGIFSWKIFLLIITTVLISGVISFLITKNLAKYFSENINKVNYRKITMATLILLILLILILTNLTGFLVFAIATLTGIYCISLKVRRTNMMGCLLLPTILFYLI